MDDDLEELAGIIELLEDADFTEFRYEKGDLRIVVRRGEISPEAPTEPGRIAPLAPIRASGPSAPATAGAADGLSKAERIAELAAQGLDLVPSPMLGTFYRSPKPGEAPFVQIGDEVDSDTVVCIVEVMKLMNSVRAGVTGIVVEVLAEDGDLVEFDQPIVAIRTRS